MTKVHLIYLQKEIEAIIGETKGSNNHFTPANLTKVLGEYKRISKYSKFLSTGSS